MQLHKRTQTRLLNIIQRVYNKWDDKQGTGCCVEIAEAIYPVFKLLGFYVEVMNWNDNLPHTTLLITNGYQVWNVDVPWQKYETYVKGKWSKKQHVSFTISDIQIKLLDAGSNVTLYMLEEAAKTLGD